MSRFKHACTSQKKTKKRKLISYEFAVSTITRYLHCLLFRSLCFRSRPSASSSVSGECCATQPHGEHPACSRGCLDLSPLGAVWILEPALCLSLESCLSHLPREHQAGGSSKRTPRFPLIALKGNKAEIIAEVQREDRGVFQQCLRKGKVWQSSQLHGVRQGLGGAEPVRGALLFSLPCSSSIEQLKSAVNTKVQARSKFLTEELRMVFTSTQSNFWRCNRDPWGRL